MDITYEQSIQQNLDHYCFEREEDFVKFAIEAAEEFLRYNPQGTIVDLGCGDGAAIPTLIRNNPVIGVDINLHKLARIPRVAQLFYDDFLAYLGKQEDNSVDNFFMHHALEHTPSDQAVLDQMYRTLKPDGMAFIVVPEDDELHSVHHSVFSQPEELAPEGAQVIVADKRRRYGNKEIRVLWKK